MSKSRIRFGIVGLGFPGRMHARGILASPDATLAAVADLSPERRTAFLEEFHPPRVHTSLDEMLADPEIDAVVLSLPNFLHFPASKAVLESGRHVLCEKPPTMNAAEMRLLKAEAEARGLIYFFGRQSRFSAAMRSAQAAVATGRIGKIYRSEARWIRSRGIPTGIGGWFTDKARSGGGVLIDLGVHALDAAWFLMGHPRPVSITGQVFQNFPQFGPANTTNDVEDSAFAFLKFVDGSIIDLAVSWAGHCPEDPITKASTVRNGFINTTLQGVNGTVRLNPPELFNDIDGDVIREDLPVETDQSWELQMQNFVDAILGRIPAINNATQAVYLMEMLDAIYQSSTTGREIVVAPA